MTEHDQFPPLEPDGGKTDGAAGTLAGSGPVGVGARLRIARVQSGRTLDQMAEQTKIPVRMLELIEADDFDALPARTYATGFTRTYARLLGQDENVAVAAVREQLGMHGHPETRVAPAFEPGDPERVPSARFAWLAAFAALVVLLVGLWLWRSYYSPAVTLPPIVPEETASPAVEQPAPVDTLSEAALPPLDEASTTAAPGGVVRSPFPASEPIPGPAVPETRAAVPTPRATASRPAATATSQAPATTAQASPARTASPSAGVAADGLRPISATATAAARPSSAASTTPAAVPLSAPSTVTD